MISNIVLVLQRRLFEEFRFHNFTHKVWVNLLLIFSDTFCRCRESWNHRYDEEFSSVTYRPRWVSNPGLTVGHMLIHFIVRAQKQCSSTLLYAYTHKHIHTHRRTRTHTHADAHEHTHAHIHGHIHTHTRTFTFTNIYTRTYARTHQNIPTLVHTHTTIHAHTYTHRSVFSVLFLV